MAVDVVVPVVLPNRLVPGVDPKERLDVTVVSGILVADVVVAIFSNKEVVGVGLVSVLVLVVEVVVLVSICF